MFEGYPVYSRAASGQSLFYKKDYDKWEYAHRIERWIVGPSIGDATVRLKEVFSLSLIFLPISNQAPFSYFLTF
jgi:hypothetical protein